MPGILSVAGVVVLLLIYAVAQQAYRHWKSPRRRRHTYHIRRAQQVIERLGELAHDGQRLMYLRKIDPLTFEELLLETAARRGHKIYRNKRYSGDGGIDGRIVIEGEPFLIQAKRYKNHINRQHLAEFCTLVEAHKCSGLFCHTGRTGKGAREAITSDRVNVVSGRRLLRFIGVDSATLRRIHHESKPGARQE